MIRLSSRSALLAAAVLLPLGMTVRGQEPSLNKREASQNGACVRLDQYGDVLPPGAIARLGMARLRHDRSATAVAYSSNGKMLASGGQDGTVRLWDATNGKELLRA